MPPSPRPILDHIVILVPHPKLLDLPSWLTEAFHVVTGGTHADGVTENKLVLFQDGVYLELIAFVPGKEHERASHKWGHRKEGHIVDWAHTLLGGGAGPSAEENASGGPEGQFRTIQERVNASKTGVLYGDPVAGGRTTPDGVVLEWATAFPKIDGEGSSMQAFQGGEFPFWCLDRTPRDRRVQHHVPDYVHHRSGAVGVRSLSVHVRDAHLFEAVRKTYEAIYGEPGRPGNAKGARSAFSWIAHVPDGNTTRARELIVAHVTDAKESRDSDPEVFVKLSLYSTRGAGKISGTLVDGWDLEINLVPVQE